MKSLLPSSLCDKRDEAFEHETRLTIDGNNLRSGNLNRPPQLFLELDGENIDGCAGDTVLTIFIRRPKDGKIARCNVRLHATSDGNNVKAEITADGLDAQTIKTVTAKFCWVQNENGDLDYPDGRV
jgi:hypothetical protein